MATLNSVELSSFIKILKDGEQENKIESKIKIDKVNVIFFIKILIKLIL
jgi:hypothetical protein